MTASSGPEPALALVVLAAGASRRLGTCKALVELGPEPGATPLSLLLEAGGELAERLVVAGADAEAIAAACPAGVRCLPHPAWKRGRTGSVAAAARALPDRDLLLAPVDAPLVPREVFRSLVATWRAAGSPAAGWLGPACGSGEGRRFGHPVLLGRELAEEATRRPPDEPLRALRRAATPLLALEVATRAVLDDLDTPEDLVRLRARRSERG